MTADDLNMLHKLEAGELRTSLLQNRAIVKAYQGLPLVPKHYFISLFLLWIVHWLSVTTCLYLNDSLAAYLVILL